MFDGSESSLQKRAFTGVNKYPSRPPTFLGHAKNGWSKPQCSSNRDTTRNISFCSLLLKPDFQLSF